MGTQDDEERSLRTTAMRNAASILQARLRAEAEFARAVSMLRATLEATTDAILVVDNEGALTDYNERFLTLWQLAPAELQGIGYSELVEMLAAQMEGAGSSQTLEHWRSGQACEGSETFHLADGRVIECFSAVQRVDGSDLGRVWSFRDVTARTRSEVALRANHARFAAIVDQSPVGILLVDAQFRIQHVNPRALPALSALDQPVGRTLEQTMHAMWPDEVALEIVERFRHTLSTGEPYRAHAFTQLRQDRGAEEHYDWEIHRIVLSDGQLGVACYFIDVSTHVLAQRAIKNSEQRVRATFEQAAVGLALTTLEGRFVQMNRKFTQILGYSEAELRERSFTDITHPDDLAESKARVDQLRRGEVTDFSIEKRYVRRDGSIVWSLTTVGVLENAEDGKTEFVAVIEDISARKAAEEEVREAAVRLQLALSGGQLGDWVWDARTDLVTFGARTAEILGIPQGIRITWTALRERLHEQDRERARMAVETCLRDRTVYSIEYRVLKPSGEQVWVGAKGQGLYAEDGTVLGMTGLMQDVTDRRRLESFRFRLAAVVETSDDAIVTKTPGGIITTWNRGAERLFGYTADEVVGKPVMILIPPARHYEETEILSRLVRGERLEHFETWRIRKDGTEFPVSLTVSPIKDDEGNIIGISKIARDITARIAAEDALKEESRVLNLLNQTGKAIAANLALESIVQTVTDAATQLSGAEFGAFFYNASDEGGSSLQLFTLSGIPREAFAAFGQPRATPLFAPTFNGEQPIRVDDVTQDPRYEQWAPHFGLPAGHPLVRSYCAVPVVSRTGEVIGGLFFGHSSPGIFTEKVEHLVVGVAAQAAIAIDNARLYERVKRAAEERQVLLEAERAARAETERVSLMKDEFLATLSHELRTPLNAIVGWAHVLRTRSQSNPEIDEGLTVIDRNARVQTQLIEDLLDMSRIISGKVRLDVQRVELQEVVKAALESVRHSAEAKGLRLHVVLDPSAGPVWGDPNRLQQCFWNLMSNAIKFTPKGGKVQVSLSRVNSHLEVSVIDSGQGISEDFLPYVFERFRQADASTTRRHGGLGLGLSIVKSLVELHGGAVRASSAGKDEGATFTIELPLMILDTSLSSVARQHPRTRGSQSAHLDHPDLHGLTVLMVDDEPDARSLVKRVLEDCGARVLLADSAKTGLALLRSERPHMVLSDIGMPDEDGYEFIRKVRLLPADQGGKTPAAALSAFARAEDRTRALRAGYQTHIAKPVEPTELTAVVASLALRQ